MGSAIVKVDTTALEALIAEVKALKKMTTQHKAIR